MSPESEYILQKRLPYMAGAIRVDDMQGLLACNGFAVSSLPERTPAQELDADEDHLLRNAAAGLSGREIMLDREQCGMPSINNNQCHQVRERLYTMFNAANTPHLVAIAGRLGYIACPPLLLERPQLFTTQQVATLGLLGHGFPHADISDILKLESLTQTRSLFMDIKKKLPPGETAPYRASAAWLIHTTQRLGVLPSSPHTLERLDADELYEGIWQIMQPDYRFCAPPPDSSIALAAAPFKYRSESVMPSD